MEVSGPVSESINIDFYGHQDVFQSEKECFVCEREQCDEYGQMGHYQHPERLLEAVTPLMF